jgi:MFS family permease
MGGSAIGDATRVRRARDGTLAVFAANGFAFATWMSRVPDVKAGLSLSPGRLGLLLLGISVGSMLGLPIAGRVTHRIGAPNAVRVGSAVALPGLAMAAISAGATASLLLAAGGLFLFGFGVGIWDVAQNLEGTVVERAVGRAIMPWFHAAFSLGTVFGAGVGALATYLDVPVGLHVAVVAALSLTVILWQSRTFLPATVAAGNAATDAAGEPDAPARAPRASAWTPWTEPRTLVIGVMVLAAAFTEGSANDWMAVAFVDGHHVARAVGVLALATFLSFMTIGRILGARLLDRHGRVPVLRVLFIAAVAGCGLVVFGYTWLALVGAAVWGIGASLGFPVGMSAAADDPRYAAVRLSVVTTVGYLAFLAGPPLLGFLGNHVGTLHALLVVGGVSGLAILLAPVARPLPVSSAEARTRT